MTQVQGHARNDGFALVEVLVAFVIVTLGLVSAYGALASHFRHARDINIRQIILAHAESYLATMGHSIAALPGTTSGTFENGTPWRATAVELATEGGAQTSSARPVLIVLDAFDSRGRLLVRLKTVRIVVSPP